MTRAILPPQSGSTNLEGMLSAWTGPKDTSFQSLPTRLSTKLTFRSHWRINAGGHPDLEVALLLVRRGFFLSSRGTSIRVRLHAASVCEAKESHCSDESKDEIEREVSSEDCENASDHTEAVEDAEELNEQL